MSHSSTQSFQAPPSMKNKIVIALLAVVVGHTGVLWVVSQMKTPELKPIEKKPIKVRMVTIKDDIPPPPPPQPKKQPVKPKEVKIVEKAEPPPAKEIKKIKAAKVNSPKVVTQPVVKPPTPAPVISSTSGNKPVVNPTPTPTPVPVTPPTPPAPPAPPAPPTPQRVNIGGSGGVEWSISKKALDARVSKVANDFKSKNSRLKGNFTVTLKISANEKGKITSVTIVQSSGESKLDDVLRSLISRQSFKPYIVDGVASPIIAIQPFSVGL
ncbi:protein TonB [Acinetobacter calcoaceticus]|uniref:Protein TonB n=1 Tax=Acinetobacter calcoaceticus TaxID=471 RepID=A0A4R1Y501_ACICA|nr:protein TonB [Acinetobacter calcoaceticus]